MEQVDLINEAAGLINQASTYNRDNQPEAANDKLKQLNLLLNNWLIPTPATEPRAPEDKPHP